MGDGKQNDRKPVCDVPTLQGSDFGEGIQVLALRAVADGSPVPEIPDAARRQLPGLHPTPIAAASVTSTNSRVVNRNMVPSGSRISWMDDAELLSRFESQTIPREAWTHRTHVRVAYLYLCRMPIEEAIAKLREGIQRINAVYNVPEATRSGYNETVTNAWAWIIGTTIREQGQEGSSDEFLDQHPHLCCRTLLRAFYSKAIWDEQDCKNTFVAPDLTPLPKPRAN